MPPSTPPITLRTDLRPGDIGAIVQMHGAIYSREYNFDPTFEAYVAGPLAEFVLSGAPRGRLWVAERDGEIVGSIAIVAESDEVAQLRWFLVMPAARGAGLGRQLLDAAVDFCREMGYRRVILWTVNALTSAARLYQAVGFRRTEAIPARRWGGEVVEEKYELGLG